MRILFLVDGLYPPDLHAGTTVNTHHLALRLIQRGHSVAVAARGTTTVALQQRNDCGYPVYVGRSLESVLRIVRARVRFDVEVHQNRALWPQLDPHAIGDGPLPLFYEHTLLDGARIPPAQVCSQALCLANSPLIARHIRKVYGVGSLLLPPIFGVERYADLVCKPRHATMISLQIGKGCDIALKIARNRPDVPFVFVETWQSDEEETAGLRRKLAALPNVKLLPNQSDLSPVISESRLLLVPSRVAESWGRIVTECQLAGVPVLGSDRGGLPETIGPGGVMLDPDEESESWLEAFSRLWDDPAELETIGRRARKHAQGLIAQSDALVKRLELMLHAGAPASWPRDGQPAPRASTTYASESKQTLRRRRQHHAGLAGTSAAALAELARDIAAAPRPATASAIARVTGLPARPDGQELARQHAFHREQAALMQLQEMAGDDGRPPIAFRGLVHVQRAMKAGRGAILLLSPMVYGAQIVRKALQSAGHACHDRRRKPEQSAEDDYSYPAIRARLADYASARSSPMAANAIAGNAQAVAALKNNQVLLCDPLDCSSEEAIELPFVGARIFLSIEPLRLAHQTGAALIHASAVSLREGGYEVRFANPVVLSAEGVAAKLFAVAAARFASHVARDLIRYPSQWLDWSWLELPASTGSTRKRRAKAA